MVGEHDGWVRAMDSRRLNRRRVNGYAEDETWDSDLDIAFAPGTPWQYELAPQETGIYPEHGPYQQPIGRAVKVGSTRSDPAETVYRLISSDPALDGAEIVAHRAGLSERVRPYRG